MADDADDDGGTAMVVKVRSYGRERVVVMEVYVQSD